MEKEMISVFVKTNYFGINVRLCMFYIIKAKSKMKNEKKKVKTGHFLNQQFIISVLNVEVRCCM